MKVIYIFNFFINIFYISICPASWYNSKKKWLHRSTTKEHQWKKVKLHSDSLGDQPIKSRLIDSKKKNRYGDLLNNDFRVYQKISPLETCCWSSGWSCFYMVSDRFVINGDYSHIGIKTWKYNLENPWVWDNDRFGLIFSDIHIQEHFLLMQPDVMVIIFINHFLLQWGAVWCGNISEKIHVLLITI